MVIRIAIIIGILDLIIKLLITIYKFTFLTITFGGGCVNLIDVCLLRFDVWAGDFWVCCFFNKISHNSTVNAFTVCGSNLTLFMAPTLTTISTNASVLVVLGNSWVACEVFWLPLVIRVAIASLEIVTDLYQLSVGVQVLVDLLLVLGPHLQVDCTFRSFCWRHCVSNKFFLSIFKFSFKFFLMSKMKVFRINVVSSSPRLQLSACSMSPP